MIVGILCWVLRFLLLAGATSATGLLMMTMLTIAVILHGFSYDFVFVSGYLYVDRNVHEDVRARPKDSCCVHAGNRLVAEFPDFVGLIFPLIVGDAGGPTDSTLLARAGRFYDRHSNILRYSPRHKTRPTKTRTPRQLIG